MWRRAVAALEANWLNRLVVDALIGAGLPAVSFPPSASAVATGGEVEQLAWVPVAMALEQRGLLPVAAGDVAFDRVRGSTILSTERVFSHLALHLRPRLLLLAGIEAGVIRVPPGELPDRLAAILAGLRSVIAETRPTRASVEKVFVNVNPQATLLLGQARGAAICAAVAAGLPVREHTALQVKQAVVGYGKASKEQVQAMVQRLLGLAELIRLSPGEKKLTMANVKGVAWPYSKDVLLRNLLEDAVEAGVDVLPETAGLKAENVNGGVRVVLRGCSSRAIKEVRCKVAVAADGVNSQIVKGLELFNKRKYITSFHVASYFLEGAEVPYPNSWITFIGKGHTRDGKSQLYMLAKHLPDAKPGDEPIIDMMCGTPRGFSSKEALDYFVSSGRFSHWFRRSKIVHSSSAALNFYTPIMDPAEGNVFVVGDAAAFIETYGQGAVMYGYRAAKSILRHLDTGEGL